MEAPKFKKGDTVVKAVGNDRPGTVEQAWRAGQRVMKGGLKHETPMYLVNWGAVTCYEAETSLTAGSR